MHVKPITKQRMVRVEQVRGEQLVQGHYTVARVRFEPTASGCMQESYHYSAPSPVPLHLYLEF